MFFFEQVRSGGGGILPEVTLALNAAFLSGSKVGRNSGQIIASKRSFAGLGKKKQTSSSDLLCYCPHCLSRFSKSNGKNSLHKITKAETTEAGNLLLPTD